jgi:hypothetical protein
MNDRFLKLLTKNGWELRTTEVSQYYTRTDYVKPFLVEVLGIMTEVPISVRFGQMDKENFPGKAFFNFVNPGKIYVGTANSSTVLKGKDRIICMLNQAGQITALKFAAYAFSATDYKQKAKQIMYEYNSTI